jgi:glycosyltransferase involved in cell wall biosynthesis
MRILHVTEASIAGTLRMVETLCGGLALKGHDVTLAFGRGRPETPDTIGRDSGAPFRLEPVDWERRNITTQVRAGRQLRELVRRLQPDVIHLHSAFAGLVGGFLDHSCPHVYTPHGWASTHRDWRFQRLLGSGVDRFAIARSDLVGVVSDSEAAVGRRMGAKRLTVVPNGVVEFDDAQPRSAAARTGRAVVVAGGRLVESRRPAASARILRELRDVADVRWIGGGGQPSALDEVRELGIEVTGWLPHSEAAAQISSATAYLHWSASDGQSVAVLEAMARDVVVIGSDIPANRELLDRSQLFEREEDAVQMLRRVVESPELQACLVASQRKRGAAHGADRMVQAWTEVYDQLLASRSLAGLH